MRKLGVDSLIDLVKLGAAMGLVSVESKQGSQQTTLERDDPP
jgi:hypothetical protein